MLTTKPQSRRMALFTLLAAAGGLSGCGSSPKLSEGFANMGDKALETIGFKKPELPAVPEVPEAAKPARKLKLRLAASDSLNVDPNGRSLSLIVRVYKLRSPATFLDAPYETFGNAAKEKEILADDLIESREVMLLPGKQHQFSERWAREATHVGVVALYREPAEQRWRYAFEVETFQLGDGIVLGAHACGLSVASGAPISPRTATARNKSPDCPIRQTAPMDRTIQGKITEGTQ